MGHKKHPFDLVLSGKAVAGSNDIKQDEVVSGQLYCIQRFAVENETSGAADVRLFKAGVGGEFLLAEEDAVQVDTLYWIDTPFYLHEGQYAMARFTGCTANDTLKGYLTGWWSAAREVEP